MSDTDPGDGMVPKSRLAQETERLRAAQARVSELEGQVAQFEKDGLRLKAKADSHDALVATNQELQAKVKAVETARTEDLAIVAAGFDDVELLRFEHSRAKDAGDLGDWIESMKKGKVEDAPANLQRYLKPPEEDGESKPKEGGTTRRANAGSGPTTPGGGGGVATDEQLSALIAKAQETGDWSEYMQARGIQPVGAQQT